MNGDQNIHDDSSNGLIINWVLNIPSKSLSFDLLTDHVLVFSEFVTFFTGLGKAQNHALRPENSTGKGEK